MSIVIATLGRWMELRSTLDRLRAVADSCGFWEVIVVSDGGGPLPLAGFPGLVVLNLPHRGVASARNAGAKVAKGDYVVFIDDDIEVGAQWCAALENALAADSVAVTGPVQARDHTLLSQARSLRYERRYAGLICGDSVTFLAGGNSLIRRDAFLISGGFPADGPGADNILAQNLAQPPTFCWGLSVSHRNDRGYLAAVRAAVRSGWVDAARGLPVGSTALDFRRRSGISVSLINIGLHSFRLGGWVLGRLRGKAVGL